MSEVTKRSITTTRVEHEVGRISMPWEGGYYVANVHVQTHTVEKEEVSTLETPPRRVVVHVPGRELDWSLGQ